MTNNANPSIQKMKCYAPPLDGRQMFQGVLCNFNERTIPVSASVRTAIRKFADRNQVQLYPEYGNELIEKIALYSKVKQTQVIVTNGSDQGIELIFRTFTREGDTVVIPSPSFAMFYQCAGVVGNKTIEPAYELPNLSYPLSAVLAAIEKGAKLVVICNPNNPTGTLLPLNDLEKILQKAEAKSCMVYVDEAYYEFSGVTASILIPKYSNLIITRTFSKAFGLPSLRVGYVLSQEANISEMQKVCGPYDVNMVGYTAALQSLKSRAETTNYVRQVMQKAKPLVENFFRAQKITFYPSQSNFILFKPRNPQYVYKTLLENGFLVRPRSGKNIEGTLRLTIGTVAQMKKFIKVFSQKVLQKIAFVDRDGALIFEPQDTFQIDSIEKLQILPDVVKNLKKLLTKGYQLVMVSNQDGRGTASFPEKDFNAPQQRMLDIFAQDNIRFLEIFICPHLKKDNCVCRKPRTGLVDEFMQQCEVDMKNSFMYGDRQTDREFANNLGVRFIQAKTNAPCSITL